MSNFYTDLIENQCIRFPNEETAYNLLTEIERVIDSVGYLSIAGLLKLCQVPESAINYNSFLTDYVWFNADDFKVAYDVEYAPGYKLYWVAEPRLNVPMPVESVNIPCNGKAHRAKVKVIQAMDRTLFEKGLSDFLQTIPEYWPSIFYNHNPVFDGKSVRMVYTATVQYYEEVDGDESND